ncbi:MAG: stage III sporulation protein AC [Ruminococcus sp.]|nr:stage III sporulation protein AC [Ruminococcus sp.]MCD7800703.1 stage III sporulation protein AC [Ruminococcus sp.]
MNIDLIFKIAGVGIIVSVLNIVLKKADRDDQAMLMCLAGIVVVLLMLVDEIYQLFDTLRSLFAL